jgi:hypothetical protein
MHGGFWSRNSGFATRAEFWETIIEFERQHGIYFFFSSGTIRLLHHSLFAETERIPKAQLRVEH